MIEMDKLKENIFSLGVIDITKKISFPVIINVSKIFLRYLIIKFQNLFNGRFKH